MCTGLGPPVFTLPDEVVQLILGRLGLEDLCEFGRASRRCRHLVRTAEETWSAVYHGLYGAPSDQPVGRSWREAVREQYMQCTGERRVKLAAVAAKMHSHMQKLRRQQHSKREELAAAARLQEQLQAELDSLSRARQANAALQVWQPAVVHRAHERVVSQTPVESEWRLRNLRETLRDNRVFVEGKARSLRVTDERLEAALQHLHAHEARYSGALQAFLARSRGTRRAHEARRRKA